MSRNFQNVNILLVEDDQIDVRALQRGFERQKTTNPIFVARDGVEGLEMLRGERGHAKLPRPYLILLDLNMPRMNGLQFLQQLRSDPELTDSIVFVLTTSSRDEDETAAYRQHIAGYLLKSEAGENFSKTVQMLDRFIITVEFPPEHT